MDDKQQMREDFSAAVRACQRCAMPWKIATIILAVALAACLFKIVVD